jgi:sugar lactone lactonase YvrE
MLPPLHISVNFLHRRLAQAARLLGSLAIVATPLAARASTGQNRTVFAHSIQEVVSSAAAASTPQQPFITRTALRAEETAADMTFEVVLRMPNFAEFQGRVAQGEQIAPGEMAARFLPSADDYARVTAWLKAQGLTVTRTDTNRLAVFARSSVAGVQQALQVTFARVSAQGAEYTSAITPPTLPDDLAPVVLGVHGLQPHVRPHRLVALQPEAATGTTPPYLPAQVAQAYQATGLGLTGRGQTIAVLSAAYPTIADLTAFWQAANVSVTSSQVQFVAVEGGPAAQPSTAAPLEAALDVEWTSALAPAATIRVYGFDETSPTGYDAVYQQVYADLPSQPGLHQFSISFGFGETELDHDYILILAQYTAMLANAGVTIFAASGDTANMVDGILQVCSPASDPSVTGVGGTTLKFDSSGNIASETAWSGSGGGSSSVFSRPAWQTDSGINPSGKVRLVPDVAALGDPNYGALIISGGQQKQIGGTSLGTPVWAAFCALINQARANSGQSPVGLLNPKIYPLIGSSAFRDITAGSAGGNFASTGYDLCTGVGVPNIGALVQAIGNAGAAPLIVGQLGNLLSIQNQPATLVQFATPGQNAAFAIAVQGTAPLTYQWQRLPAGNTVWSNPIDGAAYAGSTTATLIVRGTTYAANGDQFHCVVTNSAGSTTSNPIATLLVNQYGVTTLAGWPGQAASADGIGPMARFVYPGGVRTDQAGNVYVTDGGANTVRKITPDGTVTTVVGAAGVAGSTDGPGSTALLRNPGGVAVDGAGNLYIADSVNYTVRKLTAATGLVSTLAGLAGSRGTTDGTGSAARFYDPQNIAVDAAGNLYVPDGAGNTIRKITPAGVVTTLAGSPGVAGSTDGIGSAARFNLPDATAVDSAGNVYVADYYNNKIRKITPAGTVTTLAGTGTAGGADGPGATATLNHPAGVAVDSAGTVYVADKGNDTIRAITPAGVVSTVAGVLATPESIDGPAQSPLSVGWPVAQFNGPADVAVDAAGVIYVADAYNNTVRRIVRGALVAPQIQKNPTIQTVLTGQNATFAVTASGSDQLTYQWRSGVSPSVNLQDNATYSGTTTPTLTVKAMSTSLNGTSYSCVIRNNLGTQTTLGAVLSVQGPPEIVTPLKSAVVSPGGSLTLTAPIADPYSDTYQWQFNGVNLSGQTSSSLGLTNVQAAKAGTYSVVVTNSYGSVTAPVATVTVGSARLTSLSVRTTAGSGSQTLVVGLTIDGAAAKSVLVRGIGPTLAQYGVTGFLADPQLTLYSSSSTTPIDSNDNWGGITSLADVFIQVQAFALQPNSLDAAIQRRLSSGVYTAQVTSTGNPGVALIEAYDADPGTPDGRFVAVSARAQAGTGSGTLTVGFALTGDIPRKLLIRAVGPALAGFGVTGVLADPQLSLYSSSTSGSTLIASNDNWSSDPSVAAQLAAAALQVQDFPLPVNSLDAALLVTLPPGTYTAQVVGANGGTGVALIEVYDVP